MKKLILVPILTLALCLGFTACNKSSLAPGGAYTTSVTNVVGTNIVVTTTSDIGLYDADLSFQLAYKTLDAAFSIEMNNRAYLWNISPNIKHTLDQVRVQAQAAVGDYVKARAAYIANPTPTGLTGILAVVAKVQQLLFAANAAIGTTTNSINSVTQ